jgi:hypothetical protein
MQQEIRRTFSKTTIGNDTAPSVLFGPDSVLDRLRGLALQMTNRSASASEMSPRNR